MVCVHVLFIILVCIDILLKIFPLGLAGGWEENVYRIHDESQCLDLGLDNISCFDPGHLN